MHVDTAHAGFLPCMIRQYLATATLGVTGIRCIYEVNVMPPPDFVRKTFGAVSAVIEPFIETVLYPIRCHDPYGIQPNRLRPREPVYQTSAESC